MSGLGGIDPQPYKYLLIGTPESIRLAMGPDR
jgi:hypothetical protein